MVVELEYDEGIGNGKGIGNSSRSSNVKGNVDNNNNNNGSGNDCMLVDATVSLYLSSSPVVMNIHQ